MASTDPGTERVEDQAEDSQCEHGVGGGRSFHSHALENSWKEITTLPLKFYTVTEIVVRSRRQQDFRQRVVGSNNNSWWYSVWQRSWIMYDWEE